MRYWSLMILIILIADLNNTVSAQYRAKYRVVIKTTANIRHSGDFISINDSSLVIVGPEIVDPGKKVTIYKNAYITLKPEEVASIRINRKDVAIIGVLTGLVGGFYLRLKSGSNKVVDTGSLGGDIGTKAGYTIIGMILGSILGSGTGALAGHSLSTRLDLKKLELKDFSSVRNQLERYQAKLISLE
jgi:hypothetical protein